MKLPREPKKKEPLYLKKKCFSSHFTRISFLIAGRGRKRLDLYLPAQGDTTQHRAGLKLSSAGVSRYAQRIAGVVEAWQVKGWEKVSHEVHGGRNGDFRTRRFCLCRQALRRAPGSGTSMGTGAVGQCHHSHPLSCNGDFDFEELPFLNP